MTEVAYIFATVCYGIFLGTMLSAMISTGPRWQWIVMLGLITTVFMLVAQLFFRYLDNRDDM